MTQNRTIPASDDIDEDLFLTIPITDDAIGEDLEVFLIAVEVRVRDTVSPTPSTSQCPLDTQQPNIDFVNDGLLLVFIADDDEGLG